MESPEYQSMMEGMTDRDGVLGGKAASMRGKWTGEGLLRGEFNHEWRGSISTWRASEGCFQPEEGTRQRPGDAEVFVEKAAARILILEMVT